MAELTVKEVIKRFHQYCKSMVQRVVMFYGCFRELGNSPLESGSWALTVLYKNKD